MGFDTDNVVHGGRTRQGLHAVSGGLPRRQASGLGLAAADARAEAGRRQIPLAVIRGRYGACSFRTDRSVSSSRRVMTLDCARPVIDNRPATPEAPPRAPLDRAVERAAGPRAAQPAVGLGAAGLRRPRRTSSTRCSKRDETGYSGGYDVVGPDGREWDIKVGKEAQTEVVVSRILWALGYHQPADVLRDRLEAGRHVGGRRRAGALPTRVRSRERGRMGLAREPVQRHAGVPRPHCHQPPVEQLGLQDEQQPRLRRDRVADGPARRYVVQDLGASLWKAASGALEQVLALLPARSGRATTSTTSKRRR